MKVGLGFDVHRFQNDRKLMLGGIEIPGCPGLEGHSDADVLLHALMDAILGALGLGDIGSHFPDDDHKYKNIASSVLLAEVVSLMEKEGFSLNNADLVLITEIPRIAPYCNKIEENLSSLLKTNPRFVNLKASTTERLGFIGRKEGMAAQVVVSLKNYEEGGENAGRRYYDGRGNYS
ncbi:MAG: 2-C-methyl-D-erythritol 2,4-cyclodiphosphate synthase [Halanaerobiales bacterium]